MNICYKYGIKWRYEFNHTKSGVVTFGETKPLHSKSMKESEWMLGDAIVNELYEHKNLGVLKHYVNSFASNVKKTIEKARKKAGMLSLLTLSVVKQTHSFMSNFGGKHVYLTCNYLLVIWH